jgi:hypothetical protein
MDGKRFPRLTHERGYFWWWDSGARYYAAGLLLVLGKILMPLTSWLSGAWVPMWLRSRLAGIARVRSARLIGLARLASVGVFGIASLGPKGHREILQFFSNQTQFVDDLFSYFVFHFAPLRILHSLARQIPARTQRLSTGASSSTKVRFLCLVIACLAPIHFIQTRVEWRHEVCGGRKRIGGARI